MELTGVELRRVRMPLVTPFRSSWGIEAERDVLLCRIVTPQAEGWGECGALGEPLYGPEYVEGAHHVLRHHLLPRLLALEEVTAAAVAPALAPVKGHHMAKATLEMGVLDAELRARGESLAQHLGATRRRVACGVAIGVMDDLSALVEAVAGFVAQGYRRVKLKIRPGWDVEPVRAVREGFPELDLQVDANAAYHPADARHLARLDAFDLLLVEQPLADDDLLGHARLARQLATPVGLDESITSARAAATALALEACRAVNIKAARVGGYVEARRVHDVCVAHGVPVWCGGMLETGLGRAANLALAALPGFVLPADLSASGRYWRQDLTPPFVLDDGHLTVPTGPGLGVDVVPEMLAAVTTSTEWVSRQG